MIRAAWHPLAKRELFEAQDFYEGRATGLGTAFLENVEEAVTHIRHYPRSGPTEGAGVRRFQVSRFPYKLIYRVEERRVFILAVAHLRQRPRYWARRL